MTVYALTNHGAWGIALIIALLAALAVAGLLLVLIRTVQDIDRTAGRLLDAAGYRGTIGPEHLGSPRHAGKISAVFQ